MTNDIKCQDPLATLNKQTQSNTTQPRPMIDVFLNKTKRANLKLIEEVIKNTTNANFPSEEIGRNFSFLFNLLWHSSLPCHSRRDNSTTESAYLLKKCLLHGKEVDCTKLFKPVPTDNGICCSFNNMNVLKDSEFSQLLTKKQNGLKLDGAQSKQNVQKSKTSIFGREGSGFGA